MTDAPGCPHDGVAASRYHANEMESGERARFEAHLARCAACAAAVRAQRRLDERLARLPSYRAPASLRLDRARFRRTTGMRIGVALVAAAVAAFVILRPDGAPVPSLVSVALAADAAMLDGLRAGAVGDDRAPTAPRIPWLGFVGCSDRIAPVVEGVYICALARESPLARLGVRAGDVVAAVGGRAVASDTAMYERLVRHAVGDVVDVSVRTEAGLRRVRVALIERQVGARHLFAMEWSPALVASLDRPRVPDEDVDRIFVPLSGSATVHPGVRAGLLVGRAPRRASTDQTILSALPYLFGADGLRVGDVVTAVQGRPVTTRGELMMALMDVQRVPFTLTVYRAGEVLPLAFRKGTPPATARP